MKNLLSSLLILLIVPGINAQDYSALSFRSLGPATTSGRVADMAVDPNNHDVWFVATASGGVWKTVNHGLTFSSLFDNEGSYSIGCVTIDPSNSNTIWVGTGENNNQRSVAYGDGIYKSVDGGASFKNMGLGSSEHIGMMPCTLTTQTLYGQQPMALCGHPAETAASTKPPMGANPGNGSCMCQSTQGSMKFTWTHATQTSCMQQPINADGMSSPICQAGLNLAFTCQKMAVRIGKN